MDDEISNFASKLIKTHYETKNLHPFISNYILDQHLS